MDPWYDFLALPIAPLVLLTQFAALFSRRLRRVVGASGTVAIATMFLLILVLPSGGGANIGAFFLLVWFLMALPLLGFAFVLPKPPRSAPGEEEEIKRREA